MGDPKGKGGDPKGKGGDPKGKGGKPEAADPKGKGGDPKGKGGDPKGKGGKPAGADPKGKGGKPAATDKGKGGKSDKDKGKGADKGKGGEKGKGGDKGKGGGKGKQEKLDERAPIVLHKSGGGKAITINKVNGVCTWKPETPPQCSICNNRNDEPSLTFEAGEETLQGVCIAHGRCGHVFHQDCINEWLEKGKKNCPIPPGDHDFELERWEKIPGADTHFNPDDH